MSLVSVPPRSSAFNFHLGMLLSAAVIFIWSGINPNGRFNWLMETFPAMIAGIVLVATYHRFRSTTITYFLIWIFALILMIGGHYTYAQVPIGNWARDHLNLSRNHFDRIGHFFQGVVPAVVVRELLLRTSTLRRGLWLPVLCVAMAFSVSAGYELFEWRYAVTFGGKQADDFLGSQGDIWDSQEDMATALIGAILAMGI